LPTIKSSRLTFPRPGVEEEEEEEEDSLAYIQAIKTNAS
jgi:hypothetical protein